jgi:hypothetical protein
MRDSPEPNTNREITGNEHEVSTADWSDWGWSGRIDGCGDSDRTIRPPSRIPTFNPLALAKYGTKTWKTPMMGKLERRIWRQFLVKPPARSSPPLS